MAILTSLNEQPADALLALIGLHRADRRKTKIDLGVGVYRDASGQTPVFEAIKLAERKLLLDQDSKSYLGAEGDQRFVELLSPVVLGADIASADRIVGVQTPGGTGALRLGMELLARALPSARVWLGQPTWPNHAPIVREAGLEAVAHRYFDVAASAIDFEGMLCDLEHAASGDVVLLHGCCHNPTGTGFSLDQWRKLAAFFIDRGLVPFIDLAYQGFGNGLEDDAAGARIMMSSVPEALLAYSCDKNFGLYRDRVGVLWIQSETVCDVKSLRDNLLVLARSLWSMPPDHGAAVVRLVLEDPAAGQLWRAELDAMRKRINDLRDLIAGRLPQLAAIGNQRGLFAMLPIDEKTVRSIRDRHAIYMADSGRINLAGLTQDDIGYFVDAITPHLQT